MSNRDKDFRYMATSDLYTELQKESFQLDGDNERKVVQAVLKVLPDNSSIVQSLAVKCLGPLLKKVKESSIGEIIDQLSQMLLKEKEDERDFGCTALKEVIKNLNVKDGPYVAKRLTPKLVSGIHTLEALDILNDLLNRFGSVMNNDHETVMNAVLPQLLSNRPAARKKAISCLAYLSVSLPEKLFGTLIETILRNLSKTEKPDQIRSFVQAIGSISRAVGYRLGRYLSTIVPLLNKYTAHEDEELKEICFQTFEALVLRCPKEMGQFLNNVIELCLKYIKYDPNYAVEEGADDDEMETERGDEEEDDDEGEYSADDDVSWKVRRTAVKCIDAVINTRADLLQELYNKVVPALINRFREREETVKVDVFNTFIDLLKQTSLVTRKTGITENSPAQKLKNNMPKIVQSLTKQLREKSVKTRSGAFAVLKELAVVLEGYFGNQISEIINGVKLALLDKNTNSNLKTDTLAFLRILLQTHDAAVFYPHIKTISGPVFKSIGDLGYKVDAEALRVCSELVKVIRPVGKPATGFDYKPLVNDLFQVTMNKLKAQDIDQEVKECAINSMGLIICNLGDELSASQLSDSLKILVDRLSNEITRLTTAKAFALIAGSPLKIDLSSVLGDVVKELITFLRKNNRHIKQSSLVTLDVLVRNYGDQAAFSGLFPQVLTESAPLIGDSDLHLSYLALQLTVSITHIHHESAPLVQQLIYPRVSDLLQSSLLQGNALQSLLELFSELVTINYKGFGFDVLLDSLLSIPIKAPQLPRQSYVSISQCIGVLCIKAKQSPRDATVQKFVNDIKTAKQESAILLALLSLGEIGRRIELTDQETVQKVILGAFESPSEEVKSSASFAFGCVAFGSLDKLLPVVLSHIRSSPKKQYLLLHSLREIISRVSASASATQSMQTHLEKVMPILLEHCDSQEEGTRNVVAECLGKLCLICPNEIIPVMKTCLGSSSATTRSTVVSAVKFAIVDQNRSVDQALAPHISDFLALLRDPEPSVRRCTLLTINYVAHNKPALISEALGKYLPVLYGETKVKPELIREVDLGPFKHKVDDGLEIRKAAYECMNTLLETCLDRIDIPVFISHLAEGLGDHYDIKMQSHLILVRLSHLAPAALLEALDALVEPLRITVTSKVKDGAVKQEIDRNEELVRSALRAIAAINKIEDVDSCMKFTLSLKQTIKQVPDLKEKFDAISSEAAYSTAEPEGK